MSSTPEPDAIADQALREAARAAEAALARGQPHAVVQALVQLGRCYRGLGLLQAAQACTAQALPWSRLTGAVDGTVELLCEGCEAAADLSELLDDGDRDSGRGHRARDEARDQAREAGLLAARVADAQWEIRVLLRISEVLDRFGDRAEAVALQNRAMSLMHGQASVGFDLANAPTTRAC